MSVPAGSEPATRDPAADDRPLARAAAVLAAAQVGCLAYAVDRTVAALRGGAFDPLAIVSSTRIDYFWRAGLAGFVASLVLLGLPPLLRGRGALAVRLLGYSLAPVTLLCAALAVRWP